MKLIKQWKRCTYCGESKPATNEYFHQQTASQDGLKCRCKVCVKYDRVNYPSKPASREQIKADLLWMESEQKKEKQAREIQTLKARVLQAAKDADYASKGIVINGCLIDIPIRVCVKCCEQYPETSDYFWSDNRSGKYRGTCKECLKKAAKDLQSVN